MSSYRATNFRFLTKTICLVFLVGTTFVPPTYAASLPRAMSLTPTTATVSCPAPQATPSGGVQATTDSKSTTTDSSKVQSDAAHANNDGGKHKRSPALTEIPESSLNVMTSNFTATANATAPATQILDRRAAASAHGMKLWMMVCAQDVVEFAYTKPHLWVKTGPTSFSYRGGLDLTPSKPTAESWGNKLYDNDRHGYKCPIFTDPHSGSKHEKAMIEYTIQDPSGQLKLLDLDALARDSAQMRKLFPRGAPPSLVEWWYNESVKLTGTFGVPNSENKAVDDLYKRADIIAGTIPTGAKWLPGMGSGFRVVVLITNEDSLDRVVFASSRGWRLGVRSRIFDARWNGVNGAINDSMTSLMAASVQDAHGDPETSGYL
ncbi:hypothetical protein EV360DRAFT_73738 [Lentinula raphanica]|nr:hypothetical protein EV360DRAFT_73738 [Lentinula raphanica]